MIQENVEHRRWAEVKIRGRYLTFSPNQQSKDANSPPNFTRKIARQSIQKIYLKYGSWKIQARTIHKINMKFKNFYQNCKNANIMQIFIHIAVTSGMVVGIEGMSSTLLKSENGRVVGNNMKSSTSFTSDITYVKKRHNIARTHNLTNSPVAKWRSYYIYNFHAFKIT